VPWYVLGKRVTEKALVVGLGSELGESALVAGEANWISGEAPLSSKEFMVKIRYRADFVPGIVTVLDDRQFRVDFQHPVRDITPGQGAVVYHDEVCLGGGIIRRALAGGR
jgi:tRNA-specific 2-thiouridylase